MKLETSIKERYEIYPNGVLVENTKGSKIISLHCVIVLYTLDSRFPGKQVRHFFCGFDKQLYEKEKILVPVWDTDRRFAKRYPQSMKIVANVQKDELNKNANTNCVVENL